MGRTDELEKLGESEVRRRLANGGFGEPGSRNYSSVKEWLHLKEKAQETNATAEDSIHKKQTIEISRSSRNAAWASAIASLVAVVISIIALAFSYTAFHRSVKDILIFTAERYHGDYKSRLYKFGSSEMPALLNSYWSCLLVNRGDKALSVVDMDVEQLDEKGILRYSQMKGDIFDKDMKPVILPFDIEPGKSAKIYMEVRLAISSSAFSALKDKYSFDQSFSIEELIRFLALQKMDFYGNRVTPLILDGKMSGYQIEPPQKVNFSTL